MHVPRRSCNLAGTFEYINYESHLLKLGSFNFFLSEVYLVLVLTYVVDNMNKFLTNSDIHDKHEAQM
jgi:hypothetical protein